eukprot:scaffold12.g8091.t1
MPAPLQHAPQHALLPPQLKQPTQPPASCSLSLERYADFFQLLTKGSGRVQPLSELERSVLKMGDLKRVLQVNGCHVGSKTKKEVLDRLAGMQLFSPFCPVPGAGSGGGAEQVRLPAAAATHTAADRHSRPAVPADSDETMVSSPGADEQPWTGSPGVDQQKEQQQKWNAGADTAAAAGGSVPSAAPERQQAPPPPPAWLAEGLARMARASQGSSDTVAAPGQLVGRKVAFACLEEFRQGDAEGIVDVLAAGVHEGQVVEWLGVQHDGCPPGCAEAHAHYYVRARTSSSTAPPGQRARRRLDLSLDLQPVLRRRGLEELLHLSEAQLRDAWVLLEPCGGAADGEALAEEEEELEASTGGRHVAAEAEGPWRTKRADRGAGGRPAAKQPRHGEGAATLAPVARPAGAAAAAEASPAGSALVWAQFAGTWWPGLLLSGAQPEGGAARRQLHVHLFVTQQGMRLALPAASVEEYGREREARTAALQRSAGDLGQQALQRAARLLGAGGGT